LVLLPIAAKPLSSLSGSSRFIGELGHGRSADLAHAPQATGVHDNTLLIVDDDRAFLARLARAMETRGFEVEAAASVEDGLSSLRRRPPAFAVVECGSTTVTASTSSPR
jgi:PleD family two-component response regulator